MNHIAITVNTRDNRIQSLGYDPQFYSDEKAQFADVLKDLERVKEAFGDQIAIVSIAVWGDNIERSNGVVYEDIDEAIEFYKPKDEG
ncbi:hypothetical protein LJC07_04705 [Christensenellaceae bacterium OttesenSCG-928-L17]|nr:hypothetical protein [Christensenellaceae bacterium OttesenSCG-928-L17]